MEMVRFSVISPAAGMEGAVRFCGVNGDGLGSRREADFWTTVETVGRSAEKLDDGFEG